MGWERGKNTKLKKKRGRIERKGGSFIILDFIKNSLELYTRVEYGSIIKVKICFNSFYFSYVSNLVLLILFSRI